MDFTPLILHAGLTPIQKIVFLYMLNPHFDYAGYVDHAEWMRISPKAFQNAIHALERLKLIQVFRFKRVDARPNQPNKYRITVKGWALLGMNQHKFDVVEATDQQNLQCVETEKV